MIFVIVKLSLYICREFYDFKNGGDTESPLFIQQ